ncbi:SEC14 cytosolic factor-like [Lolium rigidum]|uniref:SEC14 cytosolic factor-like n=1 Tax=Lolium rigidum TaxID=89674 RepID=UPI001F5DFF13|nr:SEC14 cytosolic factor-like [Lolium rigidum]
MAMEKADGKEREKIEAVRKAMRKQAPLTAKQAVYCNDACVERFLRSRGDSVKKAAKQLRAALSWRETIGADHIIADEFSGELADGMAYVAGHDDENRPVVVFRIKQDDYPKYQPQKSFVRFLVFTLEVAVASMSRFVDQFVLLFDASFFRSASAFLNLLMGTLKIVADYYPARLHRAFVIDPPSLFSVMWKGVRPFVELAPATAVVCSLDFEDSLEDASFTAYPRTASLRFEPSGAAILTTMPKPGGGGVVGSASSRFAFSVSDNALKPWYLSTTPAAPMPNPRSVIPSSSPSLVGASPLSARSFSFASPAARSTTAVQHHRVLPTPSAAKGHNKNTPIPAPLSTPPPQQQFPRTPRPSFLQSPFTFRKDGQGVRRVERERDSFLPFLRFYRRPYDEISYRARMRPPLGGLIAIVDDKFRHKPLNQQPLRRHAGAVHHQYQHQQQHHHHNHHQRI